MLTIDVIHTPYDEEHADAVVSAFKSSFLKSPDKYVGFDTETMGIEWYEKDTALMEMEKVAASAPPEFQKAYRNAVKERDAVQSDASNPDKNILAVAQFAASPDHALVIVLEHEAARAKAVKLLRWLVDNEATWVIHNAQFDCTQILHHLQVDLHDQPVVDTMLQETLIHGMTPSVSAKLIHLGERYGLPDEIAKSDTTATFSNWYRRLGPEQIAYASKDVLCLLPIARAQRDLLAINNLKNAALLENRLPTVLSHFNGVGMHFDLDKLDAFCARAVSQLKLLENKARELFGEANLRSGAQIVPIIHEQLGVEPLLERYDSKLKGFVAKPSADKEALLRACLLGNPSIRALVAYKELRGRVDLARKWLETGGRQAVHIFQLPTRGEASGDGGARTGRTSASPRLQNIPNFMKQFVVAPDGWLILSSDYAAIQLRIIAMLSRDPAMLRAFNENVNLHKMTCGWGFGVQYDEVDKKAPYYRTAKEINFGLPFGMGWRKLKYQVYKGTDGEVDLPEDRARQLHEGYFMAHPYVEMWQRKVHFAGCVSGRAYSMSGRYRAYDKDNRATGDADYASIRRPDGTWLRPHTAGVDEMDTCYRAADWRWRNILFNTPVQGTEADGVKAALYRLHNLLPRHNAKLFAMVHDSFDSLVREDFVEQAVRLQHAAMVDGMAEYLKGVAIEVEHTVGRCWATLPKDYALSDHGLWIVKENQSREFQQEVMV